MDQLSGRLEPLISGIRTIDLEDVSTGDSRILLATGAHPFHVDPILPAFDLLHERVHAAVVARRDFAFADMQKEFAEPRPHRIAPDLIAELVKKRVAQQGAIDLIGAVEDPVRLLRQTQQAHISVLSAPILKLDGERTLGSSQRRRSARLDHAVAGEFAGPRQARAPALVAVDQLEVQGDGDPELGSCRSKES
jgi:hypothetical protein